MKKRIMRALVSVYNKNGLEPLIRLLHQNQVSLISTGGTKIIIEKLGIPVTEAAELTGYPEIFGGRVKTLHPAIFGGILQRSENLSDQQEAEKHQIPAIDLVLVDLYPFEETVTSVASEAEIIEKIDIGGVALIRAAAKNFKDVLIIPSVEDYNPLKEILANGSFTTIEQRKQFATRAFAITARYDSLIHKHLAGRNPVFAEVHIQNHELRYGENPHQKGFFFGKLEDHIEQLHGKELSYNNLLDTDAALSLISEFNECTCAIIKHNNACGIATASTAVEAWKRALAGDPVSAFGGVIVFNSEIDPSTAEEVNKLFFEILIAPSYQPEALEILKQKKNRILLRLKKQPDEAWRYQPLLGGILFQERDRKTETAAELKSVTDQLPTPAEVSDLLFALKLVKHTRSNAIVLAKDNCLLASGTGQTSRVDALNQAVEKARRLGFDLKGAVMASDAFFPFPDCVEIAGQAGITAIIQPGGSVRDKDSIDAANRLKIAMVFTGIRHFRH